MPSPIHIGFLARDFITWSGGVWFIQNLLRGLASLPPDQVRITIFVPSDTSLRLRLRRVASRIKQALLHPRRARQLLLGGVAPEHELWSTGVEQLRAISPELVVFDGGDRDLMRHCAAAGVQVLMPVMTPPRHSALPWVGYLYDCQHRHLPQFFASGEIALRDRKFEAMLGEAKVVFANAKDVLADLRTFFPNGRADLFSLPFAPQIQEGELAAIERDAAAVRMHVAGDAPYMIVCNQFWVHKDHGTAFRAFAEFAGAPARRHWRLLCTGLTTDYRAPGYFSELCDLVRELGIGERVVFTGFVERAVQQALLYGAAALVQPTLFEGGPGGGAASDAIALGVPCILSDIQVNRELEHPLATFFKVGDPRSLAREMERIAENPPARATAAQLLESSRLHARQLGTALKTLAEKALAA